VESSESLQTYPVAAPISGVITAKNVNAGSITGNGAPMLVIGDPRPRRPVGGSLFGAKGLGRGD